MTRDVHHTQPVDPHELEARLSNCSPRLNKSPSPDETWQEGCETPSPDPPEARAERGKIQAEETYNTLIQMGGRPTRPIRPTPPWENVFIDGDLLYRDVEKDEELFYDGVEYGRRPYWTETDFIAGHWARESYRFREELRRWQTFRDVQQWTREHRPNKAQEEDMERQRHLQDPHLTASLKKLEDWKEYQAHFQREIDRCEKMIERARRAVEAIERKESGMEKKGHEEYGHRDWLGTMDRQREWLAAEKKRLEWAKQQLPAVLSECAASLMGAPASRRQMEERSELEARRIYTTLVDTGGRPNRSLRPVPDMREREPMDECFHVLCHWEGECSQFEGELREWEKFLTHRQKGEADAKTGTQQVQLQERHSVQVDLWKDYWTYQQLEVDNARQWAEFWQREVQYFEQRENDCAREGFEDAADRNHSDNEAARSYVEEARKKVGTAESRLAWVEKQVSALLTEYTVFTTVKRTSNRLEDPVMLPTRALRSGQIPLRGLRSALRNKQAPTHSALGPIHSSKISKATGRKRPRPRRSKVPAAYGNGQIKGPKTTTTPFSPSDPKRLDALEAGSPAATCSSQTITFPRCHRAKPKGRVAGNKPDVRSAKPRGISKRQGRTR